MVGYRWHDTKNIEPSFGFGHGMSYTSFELSNINIDKKKYSADEIINFNCTLKNTGGVQGKEVIQIYIGKAGSKIKRAVKELKAFKKVSLDSNESKNISISIQAKRLAFYNEKNSDWKIEKGDYLLHIGTGSKNILKKIKFTII